MHTVAGVDGTPGGWAVVIMHAGEVSVRKIVTLSELFDMGTTFGIVAVDVPIGLLDAYETGGRACDRAARKLLGHVRASSVFPPPVRAVLTATSWQDACIRSKATAPRGKAVSKQTFAILDKIHEVDQLLQERRELRNIVREVHPEVCFCELGGAPLPHRKASTEGREERRRALRQVFPALNAIEASACQQRIPSNDILDAAVACWSAMRLATGEGRSLIDPVPGDSTGLPMTMWV